jgi:hypothetical protein
VHTVDGRSALAASQLLRTHSLIATPSYKSEPLTKDILPKLYRLGEASIRCCFRMSSIRPWLWVTGCASLQFGIFIISRLSDGPPATAA